jgi:hypothetical protein
MNLKFSPAERSDEPRPHTNGVAMREFDAGWAGISGPADNAAARTELLDEILLAS